MKAQHSGSELDFDYIIIGSGFGGSVSAMRLSEKGYKVLVIEKGKWYQAKDFPKSNYHFSKWLWIPLLRFFGIMKITIFRHTGVISGVGVGGGSLVYANTLPIPKSKFFNSGSWKALSNWEDELKPFYSLARKMLGAVPNPILFDADKVLQQVATNLNGPEKFDRPHVGVYFGKPNVTEEDPYFNGEGPSRTGCNFCGACMTGCRNNSKNSLDKNYLFLAQKYGAKILAENEVYDVTPLDQMKGASGYQVKVKSSTSFFKKKTSYTAKGVIFSGGVLGTIKLLLNLKVKSLPNLSDMVGRDIRTNNETLISVSTLDKEKNFSKGVAIGSIYQADENSHLEICRYGEGSNAWKFSHFPYTPFKSFIKRLGSVIWKLFSNPRDYFKVYVTNGWARSTVVLLFMQTLDSTLQLKRNLWGGISTSLSSGKKPTPFIPESIALTKEYSKTANGQPTTFVLETLMGLSTTAHILGGAVMGSDRDTGVIDDENRVFGYDNLYVIDGSMISANPGVNPSLSITAIAERAMTKIKKKPDHEVRASIQGKPN